MFLRFNFSFQLETMTTAMIGLLLYSKIDQSEFKKRFAEGIGLRKSFGANVQLL